MSWPNKTAGALSSIPFHPGDAVRAAPGMEDVLPRTGGMIDRVAVAHCARLGGQLEVDS